MEIPQWPAATERERELLDQVLASQRWGGFHEIVARFESDFAAFQHCALGLTACNGTITIEMALEALGIGPGDEVIVPAISFISTATAVSRVGATPVFVDIEPDTFQIDPACVRKALSPQTRLMIAVHFGGPVCNMDALMSLGVPVLEDAAHSHGAEWRGRRAGSLGIAGSFSFQDSKVMTCGEGGILTSNDPVFIEQARAIANQGRRRDGGWFHHYTLGTNYRLTALQAAVLVAQFERLPEQNERRQRNAAVLRAALHGVPGLTFQKVAPEAAIHSNYLFLGRIPHRDEFQKALVAAGVPCTPFYPHPLYGNPLYEARRNCRVEACPVAEARVRDSFWLPHRVLLASEQTVQEIAGVMRHAALAPV